MTGRTSRRGLGIAVAGGAAVLVLASGGIDMARLLSTVCILGVIAILGPGAASVDTFVARALRARARS